MHPPSPVIHNIEEVLDWPSPVQDLAQGLCQSLPICHVAGLCSSVSLRASGIVQELLDIPPPSTTQDDQYLGHPKLHGIIDLVLSTVAELREVTRWEYFGSPRLTTPLWFSLIKTIGHALSEDACVM